MDNGYLDPLAEDDVLIHRLTVPITVPIRSQVQLRFPRYFIERRYQAVGGQPRCHKRMDHDQKCVIADKSIPQLFEYLM